MQDNHPQGDFSYRKRRKTTALKYHFSEEGTSSSYYSGQITLFRAMDSDKHEVEHHHERLQTVGRRFPIGLYPFELFPTFWVLTF
jgi:hypothetical protein